MKEKVGSVTLNYEYYDGTDAYSDGDAIEEKLLEVCRLDRVEAALQEGNEWELLYHLSDMRSNIIEWYPFEKDAGILEIGSGCGAISGCLCRKAKRVVGIELSKRRSLINAYRNRNCENLEIIVGNLKEVRTEEKFDYVTLIGVLEYAGSYIGGENPYRQMLEMAKKFLKPGGKIFIAIENKMGMKYFNGAKEDHVGKVFAGIENYRNISNVRTFSKPELKQLLSESGLGKCKFYYPAPDYKLPDSMYSDEYMPRIGDIRTWGQNYNEVRIALFNEGIAFDQVCRDEVFDYFSNSFLVVCNEQYSDIRYIHYTNTRNKEYQTKTVITARNEVEKSFLNDCARKYNILSEMSEKFEILQKEFTDITYLKPELSGNTLIYPYIKGDSLEMKLIQNLNDVDGMINEFRGMIDKYFCVDGRYLSDFEITEQYREVFGGHSVKTVEKSLRVANIDMLLQNLIIDTGRVICIDYEWVFDFPIPIEFVLYRCIENFYWKYKMYIMHKYSFNAFFAELGIKEENMEAYRNMNSHFYNWVCGKGNLNRYHKECGMIEIRI